MSQSDRIRRDLNAGLASIAQELAEEVANEIREAMPVDTGFARDHVDVHIDGEFDGDFVNFSLVVSDDAEYVEDLNQGRSDQADPEFIEHATERAFATVEAREAARTRTL